MVGESSASSSTDAPVDAPDGGYGWVIVLVAGAVHFVADGVSFSFGMLYPDIQQQFSARKAESALAGGLFLSLPLLAGPLASALTDRFGCRPMTILGAALASAGFLASYFVRSLLLLCLTFGVLSGLGLSLCFNASILAVTYYFNERRALATGLAVCGSGIGTFVFAPLVQLSLHRVGWHGTLILFAAALLQLCVCGALIRDLPWKHETAEYRRARGARLLQRLAREQQTSGGLRADGRVGGSLQQMPYGRSLTESGRPWSLLEIPTFIRGRLGGANVDAIERAVRDHRTDTTATRSKSVATGLLLDGASEHSHVERLGHLDLCGATPVRTRRCTSGSHSADALGQTAQLDGDSESDAFLSASSAQSAPAQTDCLVQTSTNGCLLNDETPITKLATCEIAHASLQGANEEEVRATAALLRRGFSRSFVGGVGLQVGRLRGHPPPPADFFRISARVPSAPALLRPTRRRRPGGCLRRLADDGRELLDENLDILKSVSFSLFLLSTLLLYTFYDIPYVNLPEYMEARLDASAKQLGATVSVIGILNTVGMLIMGWLADRGSINRLRWYGCSCVVCGLCVLLMPHAPSYASVTALAAVFGFFISANYTLSSVLLLDLLSLADFASAYGIVCLVEGVGTLVGPPLAGYLYDLTGNYYLTFLVGGLAIILSGLVVFAIELFQCCKEEALTPKLTLQNHCVSN